MACPVPDSWSPDLTGATSTESMTLAILRLDDESNS